MGLFYPASIAISLPRAIFGYTRLRTSAMEEVVNFAKGGNFILKRMNFLSVLIVQPYSLFL